MKGPVRLFFAIPAPEALQARAAAAQERLRGIKAALPAPEGLHLTLAFLGAQEAALVEPLLHLARRAAAGHGPFPLETDGVGGFPRLSAPRVLYIGFRPQPALDALAADLRTALQAARVAFDAKPFRAHLTLARLREPADLSALAAPAEDLAFDVEAFHLYQSILGRGPAQYVSLGSVRLAGRS